MLRAENKAYQILERYWHGTVPVDPAGIARAMGIIVRGENPAVMPSKLGNDSGYYEKMEGNSPLILFNTMDNAVRQRYAIAHALGHHVLDHGQVFKDNPQSFNVYNFSNEEIEANAFAAALLMPRRYVEIIVDRVTDVVRLAETFGVSQVAMAYRSKQLGIIRA